GGGWKPSTPRKGRPMHGKTANRGQALHCQVSSQLSPSSPPQRDSLVLPSNALLRKIRRQQGVLIVVGVLPDQHGRSNHRKWPIGNSFSARPHATASSGGWSTPPCNVPARGM